MLMSHVCSQLVRRVIMRMDGSCTRMRQRCRQLSLARVEAMAMTCYEAMAATVDGRGMAVRVVPKADPREYHGSLMMFRRTI